MHIYWCCHIVKALVPTLSVVTFSSYGRSGCSTPPLNSLLFTQSPVNVVIESYYVCVDVVCSHHSLVCSNICISSTSGLKCVPLSAIVRRRNSISTPANTSSNKVLIVPVSEYYCELLDFSCSVECDIFCDPIR